ncbi:uncharacterized protein FA14DRAFT_172122 [Meira miltonrushii]|uniref:Uncharacterized protein n=1 Tax=Meira miltonrushii TaxID=1280837 RepID=A0A316VCV1_9BASI|nr:uncharacterized protein FA14DRAFT_172122 [Meira miltonrushii]PWN35487.1 hypothetical protein FA14DRAFT_172122 [Meira miltonrushii]
MRVMADQKTRRAFIGFYNVVQSWSKALYQQPAQYGKVIPTRRFTTSADTKASVNTQQSNIHPLSGMSLLIDSPIGFHWQKNIDQPGRSFPVKQQEYKSIRIDPYRNEILDTKAKVLKRLKSMVKEVESGQIIEPMSAVLASLMPILQGTQSKDTLFINQSQFDRMIRSLTNVGRSYGSDWDRIQQKLPQSQVIWKPSQLLSTHDIRKVPVQTLAIFAAVSLYDLANAVNIVPSTNSVSSLLRLLSIHLELKPFTQCLSLVLLQLSGVPFHEAQLRAAHGTMTYEDIDCNAIPASIVTSAIDGFSNVGRPELGEKFLCWWSNSIARLEGHSGKEKKSMRMPDLYGEAGNQLEISHWGESEHLWTVLVRARAKVGDIVGARSWLQHYREFSTVETRSRKPYSEYLKCCASAKSEEIRACLNRLPSWVQDSPLGFQQALFRDALQMMEQDQVSVEENLFGFVLNYQVGVKDLESAVRLLVYGYGSGIVKSNTPSIFKAIFRLHKNHAVKFGGKSKPFDYCEPGEVDRVLRKIGPLNDLRGMFLNFISRTRFHNKWDLYSRVKALDHALEASLAVGDLPLAYLVQEVVASLKAQFDPKVIGTAISWLGKCRSGFGGVHDEAYSFAPASSFSAAFAKTQDQANTTASASPSHLSMLIKDTLLRNVRDSVRSRNGNCAPWLEEIRGKVASIDNPTDEQILRICAQQILLDKDGKNRIKQLAYLL